MNRDSFLSEHWSPYPAAEAGWVDVEAFLESPKSGKSVAGRLLSLTHEEAILSSNGASMKLRFSDRARWQGLSKPLSTFDIGPLRPGDIVCIEVSALGEDTWAAETIQLLTPSLREFRSRSRFDLARSRQWASFLSGIRAYFASQKFSEAQTPTLVPSPGTEPYLDPFETRWNFGSSERVYYLPTSPEFHLKKMLALGWTRVFELKPCFRNGEIGPNHQPEFLMLEWYRAYASLDAIADDVEKLFAFLCAEVFPELGKEMKLERITMAELFSKHFPGFELRPETTREELVALAQTVGIACENSDAWDDVFFRLFLERIEPSLGIEGPLLVRGYPPSQAALSRLGDNGFADRFEVYWNGLELANAFHELNDPSENAARFKDDARRKNEIGKSPVPVDEELIHALEYGMPPSGGIALGVERLFMAFTGLDSIAETRAFPVSPLERE